MYLSWTQVTAHEKPSLNIFFVARLILHEFSTSSLFLKQCNMHYTSIFIVAPCIMNSIQFHSPTNALFIKLKRV
jgi:hypothetical protein